MYVVGVDLSGPSNQGETAVAWFVENGAKLSFGDASLGWTDEALVNLLEELARDGSVAVGLDAPLSYDGDRGSRPADVELRGLIQEIGMRPGSVMAPTAPRMAYLTLRGLGVSRALSSVDSVHEIGIVEVHPGATLGLRGAPLRAVMTYRDDVEARAKLVAWLEKNGLHGLPTSLMEADHLVSAAAAALATWSWSRGDTVWLRTAELPQHPFDFAC